MGCVPHPHFTWGTLVWPKHVYGKGGRCAAFSAQAWSLVGPFDHRYEREATTPTSLDRGTIAAPTQLRISGARRSSTSDHGLYNRQSLISRGWAGSSCATHGVPAACDSYTNSPEKCSRSFNFGSFSWKFTCSKSFGNL